MTAATTLSTHERTYSVPEHHNHPNVFIQSLIHTEHTYRLGNANQIRPERATPKDTHPKTPGCKHTDRIRKILNHHQNPAPRPQEPQ